MQTEQRTLDWNLGPIRAGTAAQSRKVVFPEPILIFEGANAPSTDVSPEAH